VVDPAAAEDLLVGVHPEEGLLMAVAVQDGAAILSRTAMKRWGRPEDLVGGVLFLSSPAAGFITGAVLPIDGGYSIT